MGLNNNNSVEKSGAKARRSIYNLVLIVVVGVLFVTGYTYILQKMYNDSILDNAIAEDSSRTDAMHKGVSNALTREDFTEINTVDDMNTERYKSLQTYLNQIRNMNSTRYFYTAKRNTEGRLIYLVDGLDLGADDFAYPGTYIEEEMIPYIERALSGENVYSQEIIDTTWVIFSQRAIPSERMTEVMRSSVRCVSRPIWSRLMYLSVNVIISL